MKASAIIAEDEPLLRARLRETLAALWPELDLVAEAEDGLQALAALAKHRPDVAFLDIRMPGMSGIEVAAAASNRCHVIFVTAYDEHAVAAFEQGAADYLLKPLNPDRLALAVERVKAKLDRSPADLSPLLAALSAGQPPDRLRWIYASCGQQTRIVAVEQVAAFVADAKYTRLHGIGYDAHIRKTIRELANQLDPQLFQQISRSALVNLGRIERIVRDPLNGMRVQIDGLELTVSQPFQARLRQM
jgi:DNA-binding LytR/AlgR family response regulator